MDCSLPGSSVHGIFQARVLEWGAFAFSKMSIDRWMDREDVVYICNGILLSHKKEWSNAICSNMDGPINCYIKSKRQIPYAITYMWNLKNDTNELICKNGLSYRKKTYVYQRGKVGAGKDKLAVWEYHIPMPMYNIDKQQEPTVQCRGLYSMFCNNLYGEGIWEEWIYVWLNHCAVHLKFIKHCKSTIFQLNFFKKSNLTW